MPSAPSTRRSACPARIWPWPGPPISRPAGPGAASSMTSWPEPALGPGPGDQGEHGRFRAAGEPGRGPGRGAQAGRDVQPGPVAVQGGLVGRGVLMQAADPVPVDLAVGDQGAVAGDPELAAVSVAGEQDVVTVGGEGVEDPGLGGLPEG